MSNSEATVFITNQLQKRVNTGRWGHLRPPQRLPAYQDRKAQPLFQKAKSFSCPGHEIIETIRIWESSKLTLSRDQSVLQLVTWWLS